MRKRTGTVGGQTHEAGTGTLHVHGDPSPNRSRVLANQAKMRAKVRVGGPIYIWQDADDEPDAPRSGTHTQYSHRKTAGKARLTAIIKTGNTEVPLLKERVAKPVLSAEPLRGPVEQWVIEAHTPMSANRLSDAVVRAMHAMRLKGPVEHAETVPVDAKLLKSAGEVTGITDPVELVGFALSLLLQPDPSGDVMREERGTAPGFEMDY